MTSRRRPPLPPSHRAVGRFAAVDDVFSCTELPVEIWDVVRDRAVVVG